MASRERSPYCPGRLYAPWAKDAGPLHPGRPPRCPCLWSDFIINRNFKFILESDTDFAYDLVRLLRLFGE